MDPQWKNQNQGNDGQPPSAQPASTPGQTISPQPTQQLPPNPTPAQPGSNQPVGYDEFASQNVYGQASSPVSVARKVVVMITVFTLLVIPGIGGAYFLFGKDKQPNQQASEPSNTQIEESSAVEEKSIEVPTDWKPTTTELGVSIKTPEGWTNTPLITSSYNGLVTKSVSLRSPGPENVSSDNVVDMAVQTLENSTSQADFEKALKDAFEVANSQPAATNPEQVRSTISKIMINGKEWTKFDAEAYGQFSTTIYLWNNGHAIVLSVMKGDKESLDKSLNDYLYPMTASVELK